jgi:hypothetical protein
VVTTDGFSQAALLASIKRSHPNLSDKEIEEPLKLSGGYSSRRRRLIA